MKHRSFLLGLACVAGVGGVGSAMATFAGCSSTSATPEADGGADTGAPSTQDSGPGPGDGGPSGVDSSTDAGDAHAPADAAPDTGPAVVTGMAIVAKSGSALAAVPGDAVPLKVVFTLSDGTTEDLPTGTSVTWISPATVTAQDPYDAGSSPIPDAGAQPTAFFIANPYRPERTDYPGVLFVINAGSGSDAGVGVTAQLADGGTISAIVPIGAAPVGDPDAGGQLFLTGLGCQECHGGSGEGSPPVLLADGGLFLEDGGPVYQLLGGQYPYPAPGLNNATSEAGAPNVAADPAWNAALLGMAAQGDMDNYGVALRQPMPDWLGKTNAAGQTLSAKDFADIYAWLKTQSKTQ
jgi:hypothetical protein